MRAARRFVKDESGMTMVLAIIMIVLLGVMGAGLLTFADRDLNTVAEQNRGQKAFEVADAGIGVAKSQLTSECAGNINCIWYYDGFEDVVGQEDKQWTQINGGVTLNDLDGDNNATTVDSVTVTIDYSHSRGDFKVISTGTYGESTRKIEAILKGVGGSFGGAGIGHPLYYSPSNITIEGDPVAAIGNDQSRRIELSGMSMFTKGDIIIEGFNEAYAGDPGCRTRQNDPTSPKIIPPFRADLEISGCGVFHVPTTKDALGDWDSELFRPPTTPGKWNTVGRKGYTDYEPSCQSTTSKCERPGFAAEGRICAVPAGEDIGECRDPSDPTGGTPIPSIADGVYGYDCTTGTFDVGDQALCPDGAELPRGNQLTFVDKQPDPVTKLYPDNPEGTLSYPFPQLEPKEGRLKRIAQEQEAEGEGGYYYRGCDPQWSTIFDNANEDSVIFIDLGDCFEADGVTPRPIQMDYNGNVDTTLVVWCGDLRHTNSTKFSGILMNVNGDGSTFGSSSCLDDTDVDGDLDTDEGDPRFGVYRLESSTMAGWLYAEGGTETRSGIEISAGSSIHFRAGADFNFLDDAFSGTPPTAFSVAGWRELYE
jgi:hypothetical protein